MEREESEGPGLGCANMDSFWSIYFGFFPHSVVRPFVHSFVRCLSFALTKLLPEQ